MGAKSSSREATPITLIAVHTSEGANPANVYPDLTAENLCRWMDDQPVSYHQVADDDSVVAYVPDEVMCWALRSGNRRSLNVCMTGTASWTRKQWLEHDGMLRRVAAVVRAWCDRHDIPAVKLSSADVGADRSGVCGHADWTYGKRDGTHTDPGTAFPWDVLMEYVTGSPAGSDAPTSGAYAGPYRKGSRDPYAPYAAGWSGGLGRGAVPGPVWRIQDRLRRGYASYAGHLAVDGIFGDQTGDVVGEFQRRSRMLDDEVVGPATWSALRL